MKKKVLFVSQHDWANSHYKLHEAVNRYSSEYEVEYFAILPHPFNYERGETLVNIIDGQQYPNNKRLKELYQAHEECDIIHFKGDEGVIRKIQDVQLDLTKPVVLTVCGIGWEKHYKEIWEGNKGLVNKLLATTPDHLQHGIHGELMPLAIDTLKYTPIDKAKDCFIIGHMPTSKRKGMEIIAETIKKVAEGRNDVFLNIQSGVPFKFAIQLKRLNHIFIDQINELGIYSNSAIEAMAYGSAVIASHDHGAEGVIKVKGDGSDLEDILRRLMDDPGYLTQMQMKGRDFVQNVHSYPAITKKIEKVYDGVLA